MTIRSDFEYWYSDKFENTKAIKRSINGDYEYIGAAGAWDAWRACAMETLEKAAIYFDEDENYRICVDDRGKTINNPQTVLRIMALEIE